MKEVTIESKKDYTNYTLQNFSKDTGLNGVDHRVSGFNNITYSLPCSQKEKVKRMRKADKEWKKGWKIYLCIIFVNLFAQEIVYMEINA